MINVLSLFDGMSCGQVALERAGVKIDKYYASEIDKYAISVTQKNYPNTVQIGDVQKISFVPGCLTAGEIFYPQDKIYLLIGGSPCQGFSFAGKQLNFDDPRSKLFFEYVRILKEIKPKYFLLENVRMKKEYHDVITKYLGVEPIEINSSLLSAQSRKRLYWTNIPNITQPEDKNIVLKDILLDNMQMMHSQKAIDYMEKGNTKWMQAGSCRADRYTQTPEKKKAFTLTANFYKGVPYNYFQDTRFASPNIRKLTPIECERLQTLPDGYTEFGKNGIKISNSQRYKMIGNGWTVDIIKHIFGGLKYD